MAAVSARLSPTGLLPRSKGGLFAWDSVAAFSTVILVEGLFDLAVLWQAGFRNTTCAIGTHLTPAQWSQLCDQPGRCVYIAFDQDANQAGQRASRLLACRLQSAGLQARIVRLARRAGPQQLLCCRRNRCRLPRLSGASAIVMKRLSDPSTGPARQRFSLSPGR